MTVRYDGYSAVVAVGYTRVIYPMIFENLLSPRKRFFKVPGISSPKNLCLYKNLIIFSYEGNMLIFMQIGQLICDIKVFL